MSQQPIKLIAMQPIVYENGTMQEPFRQFLVKLGEASAIVGTGSPEGVLDAPQYTLYIDEAVPLVPVSYRKMLPSVAGDTKQGWAVS